MPAIDPREQPADQRAEYRADIDGQAEYGKGGGPAGVLRPIKLADLRGDIALERARPQDQQQ